MFLKQSNKIHFCEHSSESNNYILTYFKKIIATIKIYFMIYLLRGLLNIGLFIFFIVVCCKATKLLKETVGLFAALIFVFGLLSFVSRSSEKDDNKIHGTNQMKTWEFNSEDSTKYERTFSSEIDMEKTLISDYKLYYMYGVDLKKAVYVPLKAFSSVHGFVSGTKWKPQSISITPTSIKNKFEYNVLGTVEWEILGAIIYHQSKNYKGFIYAK